MKRTFSKTKCFSNFDSEQLLELIDTLSEYPDVLFDLFWEISERQPSGWIPLLEKIILRFREARLREMSDELAQLNERISTLTPARAQPVFPKPAPAPQPLPAPVPVPAPAPNKNWIDTAGQIRNSKVERDIRPEELSTEEWAKQSPLAILGYHVGLTGMSDMHRQQFLFDFVSKAALPQVLPKSYLDEWGFPGSRTRLKRTARHIAFQKILREANSDPSRYANAIQCWTLDLNFLERTFPRLVSSRDWNEIRRKG